MPVKKIKRDSLAGIIFCLYLVPLLAVVTYSMTSSAENNWDVFSLGLLLTAVGTLSLYRLLAKWQESLVPSPELAEPAPERPEQNEAIVEFDHAAIEQKNAEIQSLVETQEDYRKGTEQTIEILSTDNKKLEEQLMHKERLREEVEQILAETRATSERRQQRINQLETKVRDLSYEIKTLLQLTDISEGDQTQQPKVLQETKSIYSTEPLHAVKVEGKYVQTEDDAAEQLKRCINNAQKMTGASHYSSGSSRLRGIPVDNFALDLRCLFDSLRSESNCSILVYSPKEDKLLFANEQLRQLTGWNPDKFIQNFDHIVQEGKEEWREAISQLSSRPHSKVRLIIKSRTGEDHLIHGLLGAVPTGIFRHHVIIILYSADHRDALSSAV